MKSLVSARRKPIWPRLGLTILAVCLCARETAAGGTLTFRTVALSGDPAPGTGDNFGSLDFVIIDAEGQTALFAFLAGEPLDDPCTDQPGEGPPPEQGIWSEGSGMLSLVARRGSHAPGTDPDVKFNSFQPPLFNDAGQTAFMGFLIGMDVDGACVDLSNGIGIWSQGAGALALVARSGSQAPGTPAGVNFNQFSTLRLNSVGQTAFSGFLTGAGVDPTNNRGIWAERPQGLELVARSGSQAPGTEPGVVFEWFGSGSPVFNGLGQTAFRAFLDGPGVDESNSYGIWSEATGVLELAVRSGSPAPGTEEGVDFESFGPPEFNDAGQTAMLATLTGAGVDESNDLGIWSQGPDTLTLVARTGSPAPGVPGVTFSNFLSVVLNGAGQTAFRGFTSPGNSGIWSEGSGTLSLIARPGDPAPGTGAGVVFAGLGNPGLNDIGQTSFWGVVGGPGVNSTNDTGIWAEDPDGLLTLVAREGDVLEVAPGDHRTIAFLNLILGSGGEDGKSSGFNDQGEVAFQALFTDGTSGIFVARICCDADLNADCVVNAADLAILLGTWGPVLTPDPPDFDGDGDVDAFDLAILLGNWGQCT